MLAIQALTATLTPVAAPKKSRVLFIEALSAALDCATVDHCEFQNSQTPEPRLDATAKMLATRVLEQCEPTELALDLLSAPSRPGAFTAGDDSVLCAQRLMAPPAPFTQDAREVILEVLSSVERMELFAKLCKRRGTDWVINGAYIDRALLRNQLAFDLFQALGGPERYAPESHTCRATFNGRAAGVFFLTETIKRDDDRVDVPDDPHGEAFVVKLDDEPGLLDNSPVGYGIWQAVSPRSPTPQQSAGILASLGGWQGALLGPRPADPVDGIFAFVDPDSAVDFVLLQELMRNNDAYYLSVHLWKDVGGRLRFAPWDLDLTLAQPTYNDNTNPEGWVAYRPPMIARMGEVEAFRTALAQRWRDLRAGPWSDAALLDAVNAQHDLLGPDLQANFAVWTWTDIPLYWSTLPEVAGPEAEYDRIRAWLPARTAWIDGAIDGW